LGIGKTSNFELTPKKITFNEMIKQVSTGYFHSLVLTNSNTIFSFGRNKFGELGINDYNHLYSPEHKVLNQLKNNIKKISAGWHFSLILTIDGFVYSFGSNDKNELG
jgi:alpha-tubulin suppressor-like RCC1 family protein